MEHIVQFAISFDDKTVTDKVKEKAEQHILDTLTKDLKDQIFESDWYGRPTKKISDGVKNMIDQKLDGWKDEIIKGAIKELADRLSRSKQVKELVNETVTKD